MRSTFLPLIVVLALGGMPSPQALSREQITRGQVVDETPESRGVARTVVVAHLVDWARTNQDAEALLTAARMLAEVPLRTGQDGDVGLAPVFTPQGLREEAATLSRRTDLEEVVVTGSRVRRERPTATEDAASPLPPPPAPAPPPLPAPSAPMPTRPAAPMVGVRASPFGIGPISTVKRLNSRESWSFVVDARGAQLLRVAAIGDGDTNIDLIVRNDQGQVLCADGLDDHYPSCTLSPVAPTRLRINVVNRGDVWTKVQVLTN